MKRGIAASLSMLLGATLAGCVSSPEVKQASTEMTAALKAVSAAEGGFKRLYVAEIEATRAQLARAMIAGAVRARLTAVDKQYESSGNLIELSRQVDAAASSARALVAFILRQEVAADDAGEGIAKIADSIFLGATKDQLAAAALLPEAAAAEIKDKVARATLLKDLQIERDDVITLLSLARTRAFVDKALFRELDQHIAALTVIHERVDTWIQTDVTVSGQQVARTVESVTAAVQPGAGGH